MHDSIECLHIGLHRSFSVSPLLLRLFLETHQVTPVGVTCSCEGRLNDFPRSAIRQSKFHKTVEVVQNLRIAKDGCSPVGVYAAFQVGICVCYLRLQL